jgi:hypothetical protein
VGGFGIEPKQERPNYSLINLVGAAYHQNMGYERLRRIITAYLLVISVLNLSALKHCARLSKLLISSALPAGMVRYPLIAYNGL